MKKKKIRMFIIMIKDFFSKSIEWILSIDSTRMILLSFLLHMSLLSKINTIFIDYDRIGRNINVSPIQLNNSEKVSRWKQWAYIYIYICFVVIEKSIRKVWIDQMFIFLIYRMKSYFWFWISCTILKYFILYWILIMDDLTFLHKKIVSSTLWSLCPLMKIV
jgi:hypothetical protein